MNVKRSTRKAWKSHTGFAKLTFKPLNLAAVIPTPNDIAVMDPYLKSRITGDYYMGHPFVPDAMADDALYHAVFVLGKQQLAVASSIYQMNRRLIFALSRHENDAQGLEAHCQPNAMAIPTDEFDAVVVSVGLIDLVASLSVQMADSVVDSPFSAQSELVNSLLNEFAKDYEFESGKKHAVQMLTSFLIAQTITYIIGHELGHFGSGHLSVGKGVPLSEDFSDETCEAASASTQEGYTVGDGNERSAYLASQAREFDADVQGLYWLVSRIRGNAKANRTLQQRDDVRFWQWIRDTPSAEPYLVSIIVVMLYAVLGLGVTADLTNGGGTHPPSMLRANLALRAVIYLVCGEEHSKLELQEQAINTAAWCLGNISDKKWRETDNILSKETIKSFGVLDRYYTQKDPVGRVDMYLKMAGLRYAAQTNRNALEAQINLLAGVWLEYQKACIDRRRFPADALFQWAQTEKE